jgi:hypothetical protein
MPEHEYFRQLASIAVLGELSQTELAELTAHFGHCPSCQAAYQEFLELATDHLPFADRQASCSGPGASTSFREGVLKRAEEEGLRISSEALRGPVGLRERVTEMLEQLRCAVLPRTVHVGVLTAALLCLVVVLAVSVRSDMARKQENERLRLELSEGREFSGLAKEPIKPKGAVAALAPDTNPLEQRLADATERTARLELQHRQDAGAIVSLETKIGQLNSENDALAQRAAGSEGELAGLRGELERLRSAAAEGEAQLVASQTQVSELSNQLRGQQAALEREEGLLAAGRDIRDVIAARNLHIIDVHDMDARGESRPFGRIFLTEGKRLIFYAYDLDSIKMKNASFQAWGEGEDGKRTAVNLGILYLDDRTQSRWALKVEDPNLLKALNSVFVTVEPRGGTDKPTGKKLMYAYLRNPINHP